MTKKQIKRPVNSLDTSNQQSLFTEEELAFDVNKQDSEKCIPDMQFNDPDPKKIYLNQVRLDTHLKNIGQTAPLKIRSFLDKLDLDAFESSYKPGGRPPYAPRAMLGIILLGIMQNVSSLRDLEKFAKTNLGALWVGGGIIPDHSIIGRFVQRHEAQLTEDFFHQLTVQVLKVTGSKNHTIAGDGTVIEAASSHFKVVRKEALNRAIKEARHLVKQQPDNKKEIQRLSELEAAEEALSARQEKRKAKGKKFDGLTITPLEPESVVQPQKDKQLYRSSYKPSVVANDTRIVLGMAVNASSETSVVESMLDQAQAKGHVDSALFDAGYFCETVFRVAQKKHLELLCPEGKSQGASWNKKSKSAYPKSLFNYNADLDCYYCPQGKALVKTGCYQGNEHTIGYERYKCPAAECNTCDLKPLCTKSTQGRHIKRYASDSAKDAMRKKMAQDDIRKRYNKRAGMVEPVFSHLRYRQGLNRFRRKGLKAVKVEFALHIIAYNLHRMLALKWPKNTLKWYKLDLIIIIRALLADYLVD